MELVVSESRIAIIDVWMRATESGVSQGMGNYAMSSITSVSSYLTSDLSSTFSVPIFDTKHRPIQPHDSYRSCGDPKYIPTSAIQARPHWHRGVQASETNVLSVMPFSRSPSPDLTEKAGIVKSTSHPAGEQQCTARYKRLPLASAGLYLTSHLCHMLSLQAPFTCTMYSHVTTSMS